MEDKLKIFDPTRQTCTQHPKHKLQAIDLSLRASPRLLCANCIQDPTNSKDINTVLTKSALDDLTNSILQLYYQEISNTSRDTLFSQVDQLFDELTGLLRVLRAKIKERISTALKSSLNSDTMQHIENLQFSLLEKLTKFAEDPSLLKEGEDIESFVKIYNFITTLQEETAEERQRNTHKGLFIVQATKEQVVPLKKSIVHWLENLMKDNEIPQVVTVPLKKNTQSETNQIKSSKQNKIPPLMKSVGGDKSKKIPLKQKAYTGKRTSTQQVKSLKHPTGLINLKNLTKSLKITKKEPKISPPRYENQDNSLSEAEQELPRMHIQATTQEDLLKTPSPHSPDENFFSSGAQSLKNFQLCLVDSCNSQNSPIEERNSPIEERKSPESDARRERASGTPVKKVIKDIRDNYTLETLLDDRGEQVGEIANLEVNLRYRDLDDNGVKEVATKVKLLRHLVALALDFSSCTQITDVGVCALASELSNLPFLEAISLKFNSCYLITDKSLLQLASALNKLKKLELVSIHLNSCYQITDEGLVQIALGINRLLRLHTLVIDLSLCNTTHNAGITDYGIAQFTVYLKQVSSLQHLTFNLSSWNMSSHPLTDQGLTDFAANIFKLQRLRTLKLDFTWCINLTDKGIHSLANSLSRLKLLTVLKLDFSWCKALSDRGIIPFSSSITNLSRLKTLHLNFSYCNQIHDDAIRELAENLPKLPKLTHLALNFTWCSALSDLALIYLSQQLPMLPELESLALHFNNLATLTDQGLTDFSGCLPALDRLQNLTLYFSHCAQISEIGHDALAEQLGLVANLQRLSLYFTGCKNITAENITTLSSNLQKMLRLKALTLDYSNCPHITKESIIKLKQAMSEVEELKETSNYFFEGEKGERIAHGGSIVSKQYKEDLA